MPPEGSSETPMATVATEEPVPVIAPEPKRRRVRRKTSATATTDEPVVEPNEVEPAGAAVELDVTPAEAAVTEPEAAPEPQPEPVAAAVAPVDIAAIIEDDPNQIVAPPAKAKRGWWRR